MANDLACSTLLTEGLEHDRVQQVPVALWKHGRSLALLCTQHADHRERLHGLPRDRPAHAVAPDDVLGGGKRIARTEPRRDDLTREPRRHPVSQPRLDAERVVEGVSFLKLLGHRRV